MFDPRSAPALRRPSNAVRRWDRGGGTMQRSLRIPRVSQDGHLPGWLPSGYVKIAIENGHL